MTPIAEMSPEELKTLWLKTFGRPAPIRAAWFMKGNLAYHQHCKAHGGLSMPTINKLKIIATGKTESKSSAIRPGTKFIRVWQGKPHEVTAMGDRVFQYQGQAFKSLSGIARHITGTAWSGNAFFGLNKVNADAQRS